MRATTLCAAALVTAPLLAAPAHRLGPPEDPSNPELRDLPGQQMFFDPTATDIAPTEPDAPYFDIELNLGLRGSYEQDSDGSVAELLLVPAARLVHDGPLLRLAFDGSAGIGRPDDETATLRSLRLAVAADYEVDRLTTLSGSAEFELNQGDRFDLDPGTALRPSSLVGTAEAQLTRRFAKLDLTVRGGVARSVYGDGETDAGERLDGSADNVTTLDGGLRLGLAIGPILTAFVDASVARDDYDGAGPQDGAQLDGQSYALRGGFSGDWRQVLTAEASVGLGLRRYDDAALATVATTLYDASLTYRINETTSLAASLSTSIAPPGFEDEETRIVYAAGLDFNHTVNRWLALRASAGWSLETSGEVVARQGASFGMGADYTLNAHADLSADYGFSRTQSPDAADDDAHRLTVGLTLSN